MCKILLVHPLFPTSYWGFQDALRLVDKRASLPPLGLITLAGCLPERWELRLVDINVTTLSDDDLRWADVVFLCGMLIQLDSMLEVTARAKRLGRPVVMGGPTATTAPEVFPDADLIFQGEVEGRVDELVRAVESLGGEHRSAPQLLPLPEHRPDLTAAPVPRFDLLDLPQYSSMSIQYSRGCPFRCEFCDVIEIFGRVCRVKSGDQILAELEELHRLGFVGSIFLVDDNFIGNRREVRQLLPRMARWQEAHGRPFDFYTEASVNLASDPDLMESMVTAGFRSVFVGIETPSKEALAAVGKGQNLALDLSEAVRLMTRAGLEVMGGFIVGFDSDDAGAFEAQRAFIQASPIPLAMVGLLIALPGTALWRRLDREGRLRQLSSGDQFARSNIRPLLDEETLLGGYRDLLEDLYSPAAYYRRCEQYVSQVSAIPISGWQGLGDIRYFLKAVLKVGVQSPRRLHFWRLLARSLGAPRHTIKWSVVHALQGEHMIRYTEEHVLPRLNRAIAEVAAERAMAESVQRQPHPALLPEVTRPDAIPKAAYP